MKNLHHYLVLLCFSLLIIGLSFPLFNDGYIYGHDNTSHYVYSLRLAEMIQEGNFRFWLPDFSMGMPLYYYYQPIPHFLTAFIFLLFPSIHSLTLMKCIVVGLLALLPLSIYQSLKWMKLPTSICLVSALLTFSIESWIGFGFELRSIFGWGLYAQLWGMVLAPLVIGWIYKEYFGQRRFFLPVSLLGILLLTHVLSGLIVSMSVGLLLFLNQWTRQQKLRNFFYLTKVYIGAYAIAAVILVPTILGGDYISGHFNLGEEHHLGLGFTKTISHFLSGKIFDHKQWPVLTFLLLAGLLLYLGQQRNIKGHLKKFYQQPAAIFILLNFVMAFFLLAGAKTFTFLQYTPLYNNLPFLRLLSHFHLFSLPIMAFTLVFFWKVLLKNYRGKRQDAWTSHLLTLCMALTLITLVAYLTYTQVDRLKTFVRVYDQDNTRDYDEAISFLKNQPSGRVHQANISPNFLYYTPPIAAGKPIGRFYAAGNRSNLGQFYLDKFENDNRNHYRLFGYNYFLTKNNKRFAHFGKPIFKNRKYRIYNTISNHHNFDVVQSNSVVLSANQPARHLFTYWMKQKALNRQKNHIAVAGERPESFFEELGFSNFINLKRKDHRLSASRFVLNNKTDAEQLKTTINLKDKGLANYLNAQSDTLPKRGFGKIMEEYNEAGYYKAKINVFPHSGKTPQWALLKVNAHLDWKAKVDGKAVEWIQMSPCFMAVPITEGEHIVEFEFGVSPIRKALCLLSLVIIVGLGIYERFPWSRMKNITFNKPHWIKQNA